VKRLLSLRVVAVTTVALLAIAFAGSASAYWRATGSGPGSSGTGTTLAITLSPASPSVQLYPGGQANVTLTISNPNPLSVRVGSLARDLSQGTSGFAVDAGHSVCGTSALSFATQTNGGSGWTVPARVAGVDGSLAVTLVNALAMDSGAANSCQAATFTVYLIAGP